MYGTLVNGTLHPAPNPLHTSGKTVYNPPDDAYAAAGYLPVLSTSCPDDGGYYVPVWAVQNGQIVQVWTQSEPPAPGPAAITQEDRLTALEAAVMELAEVISNG